MYLKKIHFPLLFIFVVLSCKNNKKAEHENQDLKSSLITKKDTVVIRKDTLIKDAPIRTIDTTEVLASFKRTVKTDRFIKELQINGKDNSDGVIFDSERPILIGDLNGDHLDDAIMPFSIEGRGGGNNWDAHYAVFINKEGKLVYKSSFSRGGDLAERQIQFMSIKNGVIKGMEVPGFKFPEGDSVSVNYVYRKGELIASSVKK